VWATRWTHITAPHPKIPIFRQNENLNTFALPFTFHPSQIKTMAAMSLIPLELDQFPYPTSISCDLASTLSADVILCLYYTSQIQQLVMRGIVECLIHVKEGSVEAGDDDDDEEEGDFEEDEYEEGESGEEEGDEEEGDGGDEPPAKRRKKDEDEDKKKKEEKEGGKKEEEVCLRLNLELTSRRKVRRKKRMKKKRMMMMMTTEKNMTT
jgi:hypothetical protein